MDAPSDGLGSAALDIQEGEHWERVSIPVGPNKGELSLLSQRQTEEENADIEAARNGGTASMETLKQKYGGRFAGAGNGWVVWPSSTFMAQFLVQCPSFVRNKSVVEVGCGVGLSGIAAAKAGAARVWMIDKDSVALEVAAKNAKDNDVADRISFLDLDWTQSQAWPDPLPACDVLIGSDVLFNVEVLNGLVDFSSKLLPADGRFLLCDPRQRMLRPLFREACIGAGMEYDVMLVTGEMILLNIMPLS